MTRQERACLTSFVRAGHRVSVYSYDTPDLPAGIERRDAAEILPRSALYRDRTGGPHHGTVSQFSNHFRYAMIAKTGLAWIDTDVICLKSDWPRVDWLLAPQDGCLINTAIIGVPRGHAFIHRALEVTERLHGVTVFGITGPHLMTTLVSEFRLHESLLPIDALYPLHYSRAVDLLKVLGPNDSFQITGRAYCIHLWNENLRMHGYDKAAGPPPGSALSALLQFGETGTWGEHPVR